VLKDAGLLGRAALPSKKGTGFQQPLQAHEHWHVDVSYVNIRGTFYFLCSILDGCSRFVVHWDLREQMLETDIEVIVQRGREMFPGVTPRIISDNGPQFIAKDFKAFVRLCGMTHVRTSPYYPQSNGKIERWHKTLKTECIRPRTPLSLDDAKRSVTEFVTHYNDVRLHSAIGYITPKDKLEGRAEQIQDERDRKLTEARERRALQRRGLATDARPNTTMPTRTEDRATVGTDSSAVPGANTDRGGTMPPSDDPFGTKAPNPTSPHHSQTRPEDKSISG